MTTVLLADLRWIFNLVAHCFYTAQISSEAAAAKITSSRSGSARDRGGVRGGQRPHPIFAGSLCPCFDKIGAWRELLVFAVRRRDDPPICAFIN
ncbi:protein of unknown function [Methylocella tundrae]|uniref:Uncharacterized protein n=1 Tax=Methylocella tundrae TaxID=227605 RepID=A0A4U8Z5I2_METTU|nr:protein of unknown function [Methylocella tundrae]